MMIWVRLAHPWGAPPAGVGVRLVHPLVRRVRGVRYLRGVRHMHPLPSNDYGQQVLCSDQNGPE